MKFKSRLKYPIATSMDSCLAASSILSLAAIMLHRKCIREPEVLSTGKLLYTYSSMNMIERILGEGF